MARTLHTYRFASVIVAGLCLLFARDATAQGFDKMGVSKKKIVLHRRLPAVIHFTGATFQVKVTAHDPKYADMASILKDRLETEISKSNPHLQSSEKSPELVINCRITSADFPPEEHLKKAQTTFVKVPNGQGKQQTKAMDVQVDYTRIKGSLEISYDAKDRGQRALDAKNVSAKYSEDFDSATKVAASKSGIDKVEDPFKRIFGKKTEEPNGPPSPSELRDKLVNEAIDQIVPRITTTNETVEVLLARGKLDDANKSAEGGLWTHYLEQLEQMTPFPKTKDDAYRLYDIGVAYEALAYQSESEDAARKNLQEAAINYGKAVDAKPDEKNFIEPQKRIETAMGYFRKLETERKEFDAANSQPAKPNGTSTTTTTNLAPPSASGNASKRPSPGAAKPSSGASKPAPKPVVALTNNDVIRMAKEGFEDRSIIDTINNAQAVDFDLSIDGKIALKHGGVTTEVQAAMRARANKASRRAASPGNN
jgi:hypothetical protein